MRPSQFLQKSSVATLLISLVFSACDQGSGWVFDQGFCYTLRQASLNFTDAQTTCLNLGGYLVKVQSDAEYQFLETLKDPNDPQPLHVWLGLNDLDGDDQLTWTYSPGRGSYRRWSPGSHRASLGKGKNCVRMTVSDVGQSVWDLHSCSATSWFLCEKGEIRMILIKAGIFFQLCGGELTGAQAFCRAV